MSFQIRIEPRGEVIDCAQGQTVLAAGLSQNILISYGCRSGLCGSCKGKLLAGKIDYPDGQPAAITTQEVEQGYALFCQAIPLSDLTIQLRGFELVEDLTLKTLVVKVDTLISLCQSVRELRVQLPPGQDFPYQPGQWVYFLLPDGKRRAYSIANAPDSGAKLEFHVRAIAGGKFSDLVFGSLEPGALLRLEGPHGNFYYRASSKPLLLIAGGTGFAPIKAILQAAIATSPERSVHLFCGSRDVDDLYQRASLANLPTQHEIRVDEVLSHTNTAQPWSGLRGYVHEAVLEAYPDLAGYQVYLAGPPEMIHAASAAFLNAGLDPDELFTDSFEYAID